MKNTIQSILREIEELQILQVDIEHSFELGSKLIDGCLLFTSYLENKLLELNNPQEIEIENSEDSNKILNLTKLIRQVKVLIYAYQSAELSQCIGISISQSYLQKFHHLFNELNTLAIIWNISPDESSEKYLENDNNNNYKVLSKSESSQSFYESKKEISLERIPSLDINVPISRTLSFHFNTNIPLFIRIRLQSYLSGYYLDIFGDDPSLQTIESTPIVQWPVNNQESQYWILEPANDNDGYVFIRNAWSGLYFELELISRGEEGEITRLIQAIKNPDNHYQQFKFIRTGSDKSSYSILARHSEKALEAHCDPLEPISQQPPNNQYNQLFKIR